MSKITAYSQLAVGLVAPGDVLPIVDLDNNTMAPSGTTMKVAASDLVKAVASAAGLFTKVADSGTSGFALANSTGTILSWTAPSDGQVHTVMAGGTIKIGSNMTGGELAVSGTDPGGTAFTLQVAPAGGGAGETAIGLSQAVPMMWTIQAGSTFTLKQFTALTAGAATVWAQIWAV